VIVLVLVVFAALGYFFIAKSDVVADDESPLLINDAMDSMDAATRADFEEQTREMKDVVLVMDDVMPVSNLLAEGVFVRRVHSVEGKALLIDDGGKKILRFEDFETDNGPNLHIYLASSLGNDDFVDLGKIKATKGNVNYDIPSGVDTDRYDKVLIWCVPFGVLFSYADLD